MDQATHRDLRQIVDARCAQRGESRNAIPPDDTRGALDRLPSIDPSDRVLTPREQEIVHWQAAGKTNVDIARILGVSPRTVGKHLEHVYVKLGVETRTAAVSRLRGASSPETTGDQAPRS